MAYRSTTYTHCRSGPLYSHSFIIITQDSDELASSCSCSKSMCGSLFDTISELIFAFLHHQLCYLGGHYLHHLMITLLPSYDRPSVALYCYLPSLPFITHDQV